MNRRIGNLKLLTQCLLWALVLQQGCAQHNFNAYDDYDEQGNYNDHHPLDMQPQYGAAPQPHYQPQDNYAASRGEMEHQSNMYNDPVRTEYQDPRAQQPYAEEHTPTPHDPRGYQPYAEEQTPAPQDPRAYQHYPEEHTPATQDPRVYQPYPQESAAQDPRVYQPYPEEATPAPQDPRVYQPYPQQPTPPPQDPNVIMVPRLGLIRGQRNYKIIKNRPISAYLGLKYGTVRPGLGRFQVR